MKISDDISEQLRICEPGEAILSALSSFFSKDLDLLVVDANERSISHRFAMYLQLEFPDWHVDCEYNRDGVDPKRINYPRSSDDIADVDGNTVFPDIIVHKRGTKFNYLVIEIKKSSNHLSRDFDKRKLECYRRDLEYKFALLLEFQVGAAPAAGPVEWISNGPADH